MIFFENLIQITPYFKYYYEYCKNYEKSSSIFKEMKIDLIAYEKF